MSSKPPASTGGKARKAAQREAEERLAREAEAAAKKRAEKEEREAAESRKRLEDLGLPTSMDKPPQASKEHLRQPEEKRREYNPRLQLGSERGNTRLMWAAGHGMQDHITALLKQNVDVNERNADGWTALFYACYNDRIDCCRQLVKADANVNIKAYDGTSPLMFAATAGKGNLRICANLIEEGGADVNAVDRKGYTALMRATKKNNVDVVKCLLEYPQTDLNIADPHGITALMIAVNFGHLEIVQMLCSLPEIIPPPEDKEKEKEREREEAEAAKAAKAARAGGGDDDDDGGGGGAGKAAAAAAPKKREKPKLIPGLQVNKADNEGFTALMVAAQTDHPTTAAIVECLLRMDGIAINAASKNYSSALTIAVRFAHDGVVRQLLEHEPPGAEEKPSLRCDPNLFEPQRGTALITCTVDIPELSAADPVGFWARRLAIAEMLVDKNASFYVTDVDERTPEETAAYYGQEALAAWLSEKRVAYDKAMGMGKR